MCFINQFRANTHRLQFYKGGKLQNVVILQEKLFKCNGRTERK